MMKLNVNNASRTSMHSKALSRATRKRSAGRWLVAVLIPSTLFAQDGDYDYWSAFQLDNLGKSLATEPHTNNAAVLRGIMDHDSYFAGIVHREPGPGFAEAHADWADIYFVTSGNGVLLVGGTIEDPTEESPGETRGSEIEGGTIQRLAKGDVVHIPAGTPHHVVVQDGEELSYYILKVRAAD
jgi:mannose-6-phosphate isomerase-like protein (cupin superfamily)